MHGSIWCESTLGKVCISLNTLERYLQFTQGSTFHFTVEFSDTNADGANIEGIITPLASKPLLYTLASDDIVSSTGSIICDIPSDQQDAYDSGRDVVYSDDECDRTMRILVVDDTEMNQKVF